jgi:microsomal dipeptidase-like Zn-dependent dipeptidase
MKRRRLAVVAITFLILLAVAAFSTNAIVEQKYNRVRSQPPYTVPSDASRLHQQLFIADLHADSLLWGRNLLRRGTAGHIDIPRLQQANISLQVFTVVTTIPRNLNINRNSSSADLVRYMAMAQGWPPRTWSSPKERALYQASRLQSFESGSAGHLVILRTRSDLQQFLSARHSQEVAALLAAEGAQPLEGNLRNLDGLYDAGFRMMSPTHFTDTEVAGSASGQRKGGLTELGRGWVRAMEAKSMLIDLAHASPATIREVTSMASKPVIVSHTGVKGTCDNNRSLSDEELRAVARTGGLIGIGYWETAVCGRDARAVARAIQYTAGIVGVDHVALGSDFDGATTMPFDVTGIPLITEALIRAGFSDRAIGQIMGGNVERLLSVTLPE